MEFYGIRGPLLHWISSWLSNRQQRVIVDGESSGAAPVKSGVPQGTVLGPLMFLVYINDISEHITSSVRLFADDCVIYKLIKTPQDAEQLQEDLNRINEWTNTWQMKVNVEKCAVLRCTRSLSPILHDYTLEGHPIAIKKLHTYLGLEIDNTMTWSSHIQTISNKSTKVLNFIKRNLYNCPPDTKRTAYLTLVRPTMEYAAPVWDPHYNVDIYKLERVQRRAARWIQSEYTRTASITSLLSSLDISTLEQRRKSSRLVLFYKILNNLLPISIPTCYHHTQFHTRQHHSNHFMLPQATLNSYKNSFYPRTIKDWNNLPIYIIEAGDTDTFTYLLNLYYCNY